MKSTTVYIHVVTRGYETDIGEAFFSREDAIREVKNILPGWTEEDPGDPADKQILVRELEVRHPQTT